MKKGVKDYLVKPVEKETLLVKVAEVLASPQEFDYV
jgi:two-component system, chemotaxis family, chemotaxis protein CheY